MAAGLQDGEEKHARPLEAEAQNWYAITSASFTKASHKASLDSVSGEIESSSWRSCKVTVQWAWMGVGVGWVFQKANSEIEIGMHEVGWGLFLGSPMEERGRNRTEQRENSELPMSEQMLQLTTRELRGRDRSTKWS